jgi:hypothetical protein
VIVSGLTLVLVTTTVKVKLPPGSGLVVGSAVFLTVMVGGTGVSVTVAVSEAVASRPWVSTALAVTVSVWLSGARPVKSPGKVQL